MFLLLAKQWRVVVFFFLLLTNIILLSLYLPLRESSKSSKVVIEQLKKSHQLDIEKLNVEGERLQAKYDTLEELHKLKIESLNEKSEQLQMESSRLYSSLLANNNSLHSTLRDTTSKLSNLPRETVVDYAKRSSTAFEECTGEYLKMAKLANDLGIDRDILEDAFPTQTGTP